MLQSLVYMLIALVVAFIIARIMKDHRIFVRLTLAIFVSFVMGAFIKGSLVNTNDEVSSPVIEAVTYPTLQSSNLMSTELDTTVVMSQDIQVRDSASILPEEKPINKTNKPEIINDS